MIEQFLTPENFRLIEFVATMVLGFWVKDLAINFVAGFSFWMNKAFNAGDEVYIDSQKAIIVRIGFRQTIFQIEDERGIIWRYIWNNRIQYTKLEKIIKRKENK